MRPVVSFSFPSLLTDSDEQAREPGDAELGRAARSTGSFSDPVRLRAALEEHYESVWRAVRRFGVPSDAAEDAAQEVFIVLARKLDTVRAGEELKYLYGIAIRVAANRRRADLTRREVADGDAIQAAPSALPSQDVLLDQRRMRALLDRVLDELPEDLRTVLVLFEIEGFSEREVAETCALPIGTVASRLRRARLAFHRAAQRLRADQEKS
jgi:RNA polymerase sigma-70 factor (ECF subfamily)